jgi:hypothetical protein
MRRADGASSVRYSRVAPVPELAVDLLVPSLDDRFRSQEYGGRAFDSAPGLALTLAAEPVLIETSARMFHGDTLEFTVAVPTVELALVIKAFSYGSRLPRHHQERSRRRSGPVLP